MSADKDFDVIHNVATEHFEHHVPEKRGFTHHRKHKHQKMEAHFYLYYNTSNSIKFYSEMKKIIEI